MIWKILLALNSSFACLKAYMSYTEQNGVFWALFSVSVALSHTTESHLLMLPEALVLSDLLWFHISYWLFTKHSLRIAVIPVYYNYSTSYEL